MYTRYSVFGLVCDQESKVYPQNGQQSLTNSKGEACGYCIVARNKFSEHNRFDYSGCNNP
ncbi:MAG: hypothetical protein K0R82_391 [Flavipsychrobacter sp.]|jgi:hypothetical protein|nr:hypothetical protein [Flavipsychrobacter sp.]